MGKALGGGSGWVLLTCRRAMAAAQRLGGRSHPHAGRRRPSLALDMYEHAYHLDFGAKVGAYVDAFMENIAWERVAQPLHR